jgi:hypothetical protein
VDSILKPTDPARLHPLANLDKSDLEYIILEDEQIKSAGALPSRGWSDDLCYGTGATYLTGQTHSPLPPPPPPLSSDSNLWFLKADLGSPRSGRNMGRHRSPPKTTSNPPRPQHAQPPVPPTAHLGRPQRSPKPAFRRCHRCRYGCRICCRETIGQTPLESDFKSCHPSRSLSGEFCWCPCYDVQCNECVSTHHHAVYVVRGVGGLIWVGGWKRGRLFHRQ